MGTAQWQYVFSSSDTLSSIPNSKTKSKLFFFFWYWGANSWPQKENIELVAILNRMFLWEIFILSFVPIKSKVLITHLSCSNWGINRGYLLLCSNWGINSFSPTVLFCQLGPGRMSSGRKEMGPQPELSWQKVPSKGWWNGLSWLLRKIECTESRSGGEATLNVRGWVLGLFLNNWTHYSKATTKSQSVVKKMWTVTRSN